MKEEVRGVEHVGDQTGDRVPFGVRSPVECSVRYTGEVVAEIAPQILDLLAGRANQRFQGYSLPRSQCITRNLIERTGCGFPVRPWSCCTSGGRVHPAG